MQTPKSLGKCYFTSVCSSGGLTAPLPSASTILGFRDRKNICGARFLQPISLHKGVQGLLRRSLQMPGLCWDCYNFLLAHVPSRSCHNSNISKEKRDGAHPHLTPLWIQALVKSDTWTRDLRIPPKSVCKNTMWPERDGHTLLLCARPAWWSACQREGCIFTPIPLAMAIGNNWVCSWK